MPYSFDYLIYPYYPAYTMGCYQNVISGDNRERNDKRFVCWFMPILPQRGRKYNCTLITYIISKVCAIRFSLSLWCHAYRSTSLIYSDGENYKGRTFDNISKLRRVIHILRHISTLCPVQR